MEVLLKITRSVLLDLLRNWTLWIFTALLLCSSLALFYIEGYDQKSILSVLKITLLLTPSFSIIFSIIYYFNALDFVTLLLVQPIKRQTIILSFAVALSIIFILANWIGAGIPLLVVAPGKASWMVALTGTFLSIVFVILALLIGVFTKEKSQGLGLALVLLFYFILVFDGIVLLLMYAFRDYPIEEIAIYVTLLNPIDIGRIMTMMYTDAAALMGYTGAVFQKFFNTSTGTAISITALLTWIGVPVVVAMRKFHRKDF